MCDLAKPTGPCDSGLMATKMIRKHFTLPRELVEEFEQVVGPRKQSEELAALIEKFLLTERRRKFFRENAGFATAEEYPHWAAPEDVNEWVRNLRKTGWENPANKWDS